MLCGSGGRFSFGNNNATGFRTILKKPKVGFLVKSSISQNDVILLDPPKIIGDSDVTDVGGGKWKSGTESTSRWWRLPGQKKWDREHKSMVASPRAEKVGQRSSISVKT